jgi:hypothetical protein
VTARFIGLLSLLTMPSKHVFSDIRAYICTSRDCGMLMFDSLSTWRGHEMEHRRKWSCPLCSTSCKEEATTEAHLMQSHSNMVGSHNLETLLRTSSHPSEFLLASDCPFCDWESILRKRNTASQTTDLVVPSRRFMKHLGKHLEELALFVIPQPDGEDEDPDEVDSNAVHAAHMDDSESVSTLSSFRSVPSLTKIQGPEKDIHSSQQGDNLDFAAIESQQANAMQLQESGTKVVPASYNPNNMFNGHANAQNGQPGGIDSAMLANGNAQGGPTREQMQILVMQREKLRQEQMRSKANNSARAQAIQQAQQRGQKLDAIDVETDSKLAGATRCICGQQEYPGLPHRENNGASNAQVGDAGGLFVQCDSCYVWQHGGCIGILDKSQSPDVYHCELCRPLQHKVHTGAQGNRWSIYTPLTSTNHRISHQRGTQSQHDSHSESFNCPVDTCKRHKGKGLSRMSGLVKHLAAVHGIKKTASDIRRERKGSAPHTHQERDSISASPTGPTLSKHVLPLAEAHGQSLAPSEPSSPSTSSPKAKRLPSIHEITSALTELAEAATQEISRQQQGLAHHHSQSFGSAILQSPLAPINEHSIYYTQDAPDEPIECICGVTADDGFAVACGTCNQWAHAVCYYPQHGDTLPAELQHTCIQCRPDQSRLVGLAAAVAAARLHQEVQSRRRSQQLERKDFLHPSPTTQLDATASPSTQKQTISGSSHSQGTQPEHRQQTFVSPNMPPPPMPASALQRSDTASMNTNNHSVDQARRLPEVLSYSPASGGSSVLSKMSHQGPPYEYTITAEAPSLSSTGSSSPQIPINLMFEGSPSWASPSLEFGTFSFLDECLHESFEGTACPRCRRTTKTPISSVRSGTS